MNSDNKEFYLKNKIITDKNSVGIVPGSGVNLDRFQYCPLKNKDKTIFTFIGRIFKDKGIEEFLIAANNLKTKYKDIYFEIVGAFEENKYQKRIEELERNNIIKYYGRLEDVRDVIKESTCIVLPSYGEGRGTVLQEGAAIGRPLIACNTYGTKETVENGKNGFLCNVKDAKSLENAMEKFYELPFEVKKKFGDYSRKKAEKEFDRKYVIDTYMNVIKERENEKNV